ncbi:hypothetical protein JCM10207_004346 [Rhodosporidiobolus poonsookiae]
MAPAPVASTTTAPSPSELSKAELRALKTNLLTEWFRFAPETFSKGGMEAANRSLYAATAKVEQSLQKLVDDGVEGFEEDEVQRGIYQLETLLEDAIDTQFDLFEIYILRNTFDFSSDLLPYVELPHQAALDPSLRDADGPTLDEYGEELRQYEAELQKERELAAAEVFVKAKAQKVGEQAELIGYLRQPGKLSNSSRVPILSTQLSSLLTHLSTLASTPSPSSLATGGAPTTSADEDATPWAASRAAFVNWAAAAKAGPAAAGEAVQGGGDGDATVGAVQRAQEEAGSAGDAKALLAAMGR